MENLLEDCQRLIWKKVFDGCIKEMPLMVAGFYCAIDDTICNDADCRCKSNGYTCTCIVDLFDHYNDRAEEIISTYALDWNMVFTVQDIFDDTRNEDKLGILGRRMFNEWPTNPRKYTPDARKRSRDTCSGRPLRPWFTGLGAE